MILFIELHWKVLVSRKFELIFFSLIVADLIIPVSPNPPHVALNSSVFFFFEHFNIPKFLVNYLNFLTYL